MYSTVQEYYRFLEKQKQEKKAYLLETMVAVNVQMDAVMSSHGWYPKGKGFYTKQFNGKAITIQFRCSYQDGLGDGGLPEFIHDKSIPDSIEKLQMRYFHWNDHKTSGWSLDVILERMEKFYNKYTLGI